MRQRNLVQQIRDAVLSAPPKLVQFKSLQSPLTLNCNQNEKEQV